MHIKWKLVTHPIHTWPKKTQFLASWRPPEVLFYNIILNSVPKVDSSPKAATLIPVYTQYIHQLPASGTVLRITLYKLLNFPFCQEKVFSAISLDDEKVATSTSENERVVIPSTSLSSEEPVIIHSTILTTKEPVSIPTTVINRAQTQNVESSDSVWKDQDQQVKVR